MIVAHVVKEPAVHVRMSLAERGVIEQLTQPAVACLSAVHDDVIISSPGEVFPVLLFVVREKLQVLSQGFGRVVVHDVNDGVGWCIPTVVCPAVHYRDHIQTQGPV